MCVQVAGCLPRLLARPPHQRPTAAEVGDALVRARAREREANTSVHPLNPERQSKSWTGRDLNTNTAPNPKP